VKAFKDLKPTSLKKLTEVAVTLNPLQYAARTLTHNSPILKALYEGDVDYEMCDPRHHVPNKQVLFYSGNQWLEMAAHENLRRYVVEGGTIVAFRSYPRKDEDFKPYQVVGFEDPARILFEFKRQFTIKLGKDCPAIPVHSSVYVFDGEGCKKIQADLGAYGKQTIGYIKKVGKGRIIHLGVEPTPDIVLGILNYLETPLFAHSITRDVKTAIFSRGTSHYLVVVNNGKEDKSATIFLPALGKKSGKLTVRDVISGEKIEYVGERRRTFSAPINRKDGRLFELRVSGS
jgi:hypothetical protein